MTIDLNGPEMDLVEGVSFGKSGNSGIMLAKITSWNELAESLQEAFQAQLNALENGDKIRPIDIEKLCNAFQCQQGALKNKIRGYQVRIKLVRNKPVVSVRWTQLVDQDKAAAKKDSKDFIAEVNAEDITGDRMKGGLNLTRAFTYHGKRYVISDKLKDATYDRGDELDVPRYYFLNVSVFWHGGNPKHRSK